MDRKNRPNVLADCSKKIKRLGWELVVCSLLALFCGIISIGNLGSVGELGKFAQATIPVFLCIVTWGLATGIGLLQSWGWARVSMLILSGLPILLGLFMAGGLILLPRGDMSVWNLLLLKTLALAATAIPVAIGLRWLNYFRQANVKVYFRA